ncbi:hypothetical protein N752_22115 [Desulforamulus aquiferis]|nr:hypothetical protein [Desulforamulus aquiferis]RYD03110.1 hypothetical protein N752_22115 [Desulforamulus aquiferis]
MGRLAADFIQEDFILSRGNSNVEILMKRMQALSEGKSGIKLPVFAIYAGGDCVFIQTLKEGSPLITSLNNKLESTARDFELLKREVLPAVLGLNPEQLADSLDVSSDLAQALVAVDEDQYQYLFLLN